MQAPFKGFLSLTLLVLAGLFMLISGIMYAVAAARMNGADPNNSGKKYKDTYGTSYTTAVLSAIMTLGGLGAVGTSFLMALLSMRGKKPPPVAAIGPPPVTTQVDLEPSYTDEDGASVQLQQLQLGTDVSGQPKDPQGVGVQ